MKHNYKGNFLRLKLILPGLFVAFILLFPNIGFSEGSINFINYPGNRLFLWPQEQHQLKVYANEGEFINFGASHVGVSGGFISIFRPDGTLHSTFDNTGVNAGMGIINNDIEEKGGPSGGGLSLGSGYVPGVVEVQGGEEGVWTVMMEFPSYDDANFTNLQNNDPWTRAANQPTSKRVVLAWDITVTLNSAGNENGIPKKGRVFANKYASMVSQNGNTTSPKFYILTEQGYLYLVNCKEIDPWGFPLFSNSNGIVDGNGQPVYASVDRPAVIFDNDPTTWDPNGRYIYNPESSDQLGFVNNKIFFSIPDPNLPSDAMVTDIFNSDTYTTWLSKEVPDGEPEINDFHFYGKATVPGENCEENTMEPGNGGYISFNTSLGGTIKVAMDLNQDGDFTDNIDRILYKIVGEGVDSVYWDGIDGNGNPIPETFYYEFDFNISLRGGEIHLMMADIENNTGGIEFTRLSGPNAPNNEFYYDHSDFDATVVSGSGAPGNANPTAVPYAYSDGWGNEKMLDYWSFLDYETEGVGSFNINITTDCSLIPVIDTDKDGIVDLVDIDDDNDGILDRLEYCNEINGSFDCLPGGLDMSRDEDNDRIPNYLDADDPAVGNTCMDLDGDGECDFLDYVYDKDGDNVPDHLDLDSDNDGISDLVEAGHQQADVDGNGIIDGDQNMFGENGFFNAIGSDDDDILAIPIFERWDIDLDGVPDHDDLDSDNDGIRDVVEAGFQFSDTNEDGRIDDGFGGIPITNDKGLVPTINPDITLVPMGLPMDTDGDNIPDWHDLDSDNDGINDVAEGGNFDMDENAVIGVGIPEVDDNGLAFKDGNETPVSTTSRPLDTDGDNIPDWHDLDSDNDGINDVREAGFDDLDNDAIIGVGTPVVNEVGVATADTQATPLFTTSNPQDKDNDLVPDWHDLDSDNDGINDVLEAGMVDEDDDGIIGFAIPVVNDDGQATMSANGMVLKSTSNIPDWDNDLVPDWHDLDSDNDGINDVEEADLADPDNDGVIGTGMPNTNENGQSIEPEQIPISNVPDTDDDNIPDWHDLDSDNDGINDVLEAEHSDPDNDGIVGEGTMPTNADGQILVDGSLVTISDPRDLDDDGIPDYLDTDRDGDGIDDAYECTTGVDCVDTDLDGTPDVDDLDSDNDGITDADECNGTNPCPDSDGNGIPDFQEFSCSALSTPVVDVINGGEMVCSGADLVLSAMNTIGDPQSVGSVHYTWKGPNGFIFTGSSVTAVGPYELVLPNVESDDKGSYSLTLTTDKGCESDPISVLVDVQETPETPSLAADDDALCVNSLLELNGTLYSGDEVTYTWYMENLDGNLEIGQTSNATFFINEVVPTDEGVYTVSVDVDGCESLVSNAMDIAVLNATNISAEADDIEINYGDLVYLSDLTVNDVFGNDDLGNWEVKVVDEPRFGVVTTDENDELVYTAERNFIGEDEFIYEVCSTFCPNVCDRAEVKIRIKDIGNVDCDVPNVFTPNNDGLNDAFIVPCAFGDLNNVVTIFNRWGDKVYFKKNYQNDWVGTYDGAELPSGTYFYIYKSDVDADTAIQGYISLIRE